MQIIFIFVQALIADFRARGGRIHVLSGKGKLNGMSRDSSRPGKELLDETTANDPSRAGICWEKKVLYRILNLMSLIFSILNLGNIKK